MLNYLLHLEQMYTKPKKLTQSKHHLGLLAKSLWRSFAVHPPTKSWLLMRLLSHHRLLIPIIRKNEAFVDWTCTVLENGEGRNSFPWKKVLVNDNISHTLPLAAAPQISLSGCCFPGDFTASPILALGENSVCSGCFGHNEWLSTLKVKHIYIVHLSSKVDIFQNETGFM